MDDSAYGLKLHLGSCGSRKPGFVGVDIREDPENVDMVHDLNMLPWPWPDDSVTDIYADNILEHLCPLGPALGQLNIAAVMSEIFRVLKPGGIVEILVPSTDGRGAWQDPTHVTYWNRNTFLYFVKGESMWSGPENSQGYPQFVANRRDLGITDATDEDMGITWVAARLMKPREDEDGTQGRSEEGADFQGES